MSLICHQQRTRHEWYFEELLEIPAVFPSKLTFTLGWPPYWIQIKRSALIYPQTSKDGELLVYKYGQGSSLYNDNTHLQRQMPLSELPPYIVDESVLRSAPCSHFNSQRSKSHVRFIRSTCPREARFST